MTIVDSKGYRLILCRRIVTAGIVLTSFISSQAAQAAGGDLDSNIRDWRHSDD